MGTESRNGCEGCDAAKVGQGHVPDDIYQQARGSFSKNELINLTLAIIVINGWNRLAISFRTLPGSYQPARQNNVRTRCHGSLAQKEGVRHAA